MAKIMLVEDDNNLREIYGERLLAEGYTIVSAADGEEALALAVKERPDLIISDVMMPKISGFDMLDILRQTPETKYTKIIMMTALSQLEDKDRANKLGADKYLVKSQVTLEDVARVVHDILNEPSSSPADTNTPTATAPTQAVPTTPVVTAPPVVVPVTPAAEPIVPIPTPVPVTTPEPAPVTPEPAVATVAAPAILAAPVPAPVTPVSTEPRIVPAQPLAVEPTNTPTATAPTQAVPTTPVVTAPPVVVPVTPAAEPIVPAPTPVPVTTPEPAPVTPEPAVATDTTLPPAFTPISSPEPVQTEPTTGTSPNAVSATSLNTAPDNSPMPAGIPNDTSQQTAEQEVAAVAQQIESFLNSNTTQDTPHQEPMIEPPMDAAAAVEAIMTPSAPTTGPMPAQAAPPIEPTLPQPTSDSSVPSTMDNTDGIPDMASTRKKVIAPIHNPEEAPSIYQLYEKEMAQEAASTATANENTIIAAPPNPIANASQDSSPPPLETFDPTSLGSVQTEDQSGSIAPAAAPPDSTTPPVPAAPAVTPAVNTTPTTPGSTLDPNQIAL